MKTILLKCFLVSSVLLPVYAVIFGTTYNNTIELRNDAKGSEYFHFRYCEQLEEEPFAFFLQSTDPDVWEVKTSGRWNGVIWGIKAEYEEIDGNVPQTERTLFDGRNILTGAPLSSDLLTVCTRETEGCNLSLTFGNHQDDWDFVVARKDSILAANGLTDDSPEWDKAAAMAYHCYWRRLALPDPPEGAGYFVHPVDFLKNKGWCVGAGNAFVGLCSVMGIPARVCEIPGHATAEAYIDGRWRWAENSPNMLGDLEEGASLIPDSIEEHGPLFTYSLADMLTDPHRYGFGSYYGSKPTYEGAPLTDEYVEYLLESGPQWRFILNDAYSPYNDCSRFLTLLSAREISLLYSGDVTTVRAVPGDTLMWLMQPFHGKRVWKGWASAQVTQSNGVRQRFFLNNTAGLKKIESFLVIDTADAVSMPADGGDWYYSVNGHKYYLRDYGGWNLQVHPFSDAAHCLVFSIPLEVLDSIPATSYAPEPRAEKKNVSVPSVHLTRNKVVAVMPAGGMNTIVIRSLNGKVITRINTQEKQVLIPRSFFVPGTYVISLQGNVRHILRFLVL